MELFEGDSLDAALANLDSSPCVLNFASDSNPGGGWRTKQQGTQEESLCRRSSLGICLEEHFKRAGPAGYMPQDALVYCPDVVVFRAAPSSSSTLLEAPAWVSVVCGALREVRHGEGEIRRRVEGVLRTVAAGQGAGQGVGQGGGRHRVVVLGAWGCGAFGNGTEAVARQMVAAVRGIEGELQQQEGGSLERVVFAVPDKQKAAIFRKALAALDSRPSDHTI